MKPGNVITVPLARKLASVPLRGRRAELDRDRLPARVLHLRGDRPLEDQVVERELVPRRAAPRELRGRPEDVARGPDRLVRLLRVRDGALVAARLGGHGLRAVLARGMGARGLERGVGQRHRVRAHVRDVAVLVQPLREAHRRLRREPQLAARLLLERRGAERRGRASRVRLLVDLPDGERRALQVARERDRAASSSRTSTSPLAAARLAEVAALRDPRPVDRRRAAPRRRPGSNVPRMSQ